MNELNTSLVALRNDLPAAKSGHDLISIVNRHLSGVFPYDTFGIFLLDSSEEYHYDIVGDVEDDSHPNNLLLMKTRYNLGVYNRFKHNGTSIEKHSEQTSIMSIDEIHHPQKDLLLKMGVKEAIGGPIRNSNGPIAVVYFLSTKPSQYQGLEDSFEKILLELNPFIMSIRKIEELSYQVGFQGTLLKITEALLFCIDRKQLLDTIYGVIRPHIDYFSFGLFVLNEAGTQHYELVNADNMEGDSIQADIDAAFGRHAEYEHQNSTVEHIMYYPAKIYNLEQLNRISSNKMHKYMLAGGITSILAGPLEFQGKKIGMLTLNSKDENYFTENHLNLFKKISLQISIIVQNILTHEQLRKVQLETNLEKKYLMEEVNLEYNYEEIIGASKAIRTVYQRIDQIAPYDSSVLILGESGTGKELIARAIHNTSPRKERALIKVNCANVPKGLFESELFGYVKGAFTGAENSKLGKFELANDSTLFLDEIGELPLEHQAKLLSILQEKSFEPVGSNQTITSNFRLIAATNRDLELEVAEGRFRSDLYYRLMVFPITLPPLRARKEDIPALCQHFLKKYSHRTKKYFQGIEASGIDEIKLYDWPGNVRELEHYIERSVVLALGPVIKLALSDLVEESISESDEIHSGELERIQSLNESEIDLIRKTLEFTSGRIRGEKGAARILGIKPTTLESRIKKFGILLD